MNRTAKILLAIALIIITVMGVILIRKPEPQQPTVETKVDTNRTPTIIINNWQPKQSTPAPNFQNVDVSGLNQKQLIDTLIFYLNEYKSIYAAHNAVNKYDTTFQDSTYKESLSMEVYQNRLARFTRNMEVYHRTTTIVKPPRFAVIGGAFGYSDGVHTAAGLQLAGQTVKGDVYSVGYDVLNRGWYGSVLVKIRLRK